MIKFWFCFLKVWLPLNVTNGVTDWRVKMSSKFSEKWSNFGPLFKNVAPVRLSLVIFNGSHTFKKRSQSLAIFFKIWNSTNFLKIGVNFGHNSKVYVIHYHHNKSIYKIFIVLLLNCFRKVLLSLLVCIPPWINQ